MSSFIYNGREVYDAKDLKEKFPVFYHGCADNTKSVAKKRSIPADVILYAIKTSTGWNSSTPDIRRSSLLLDKIWVDENMPKFLEEGITTPSGKTYLPAPDVLELSDDEKLRDDEGNIYEIEVRGKRHVDTCYFRASDIERILKMVSISSTIQKGTTDREYINFEEGKHYKTFMANSCASEKMYSYSCPILFLTYKGLVQLLFTRRHPIAKIFRQWATNVLFTAHFNLLKPFDVMKHDNKTIYNYWKEILLTPSVVYLFKLGKVKDLRSSLKIDLEHRYSDDLWVVKFEAIGKVHAGCFATMKISEVKLKHSIDLLNTKLDERDARLAERDARLTEKHDIYVETNKRLIRAERLLDEKDAKIAELTELNNRLLIKR